MDHSETNARTGLSRGELSQVLTPKLPASWALTGWHFVTAIGIALFFMYHNYLHLFHSDLWGHVAYGEWILQNHRLPAEEPFVTLAAGVPVIATAWLGQVILAFVVRLGGNEWLSHLFAITVWVTYLVLARAYWFRGRHTGAALVGALLAWFVAWGRHSIIRPEMFGLLCFAMQLWLLGRCGAFALPTGEQTQAARLWTYLGLGGIFAAWANLHGSSIVGVALLGCYLAGRSVEVFWRERDVSALWRDSDWRFWLTATQISVLGMCCNPYGIDLLIHTLIFPNHPNLKDIIEWYPLKMVSVEGITVGASWALFVLLLRHSRASISVGDVFLMALLAVAVSARVRMVAWYAPVVMWVLAPHLADVLNRVEFDRLRHELFPLLQLRSFRWTGVIGLLAWVTICFSPISQAFLGGKVRDDRHLYSKDTPLGVTKFLREHPPRGLVCGPQWWGDWLVWQGPPHLDVMVTTNSVHLVPARVWKDYLQINNAQPATDRLLNQYRVNTLVVCKRLQKGMVERLPRMPSWEIVFEDDVGIIAVRKGTQKPDDDEQNDLDQAVAAR